MRTYDTSYAVSRIDKGVRFNGINHITVTFIHQYLAFNDSANLFTFVSDFFFREAIWLISLNQKPKIFGGATIIYLL